MKAEARNWIKVLECEVHVLRKANDIFCKVSAGSVAGSYNSTFAKTVNGLYKTELVHREGAWRAMQKLEIDPLAWVDWFNTKPLLVPIGNIPPAEAEKNLYAQRDVIDMAARNEAISWRNTRGDSVAKTHKSTSFWVSYPHAYSS